MPGEVRETRQVFLWTGGRPLTHINTASDVEMVPPLIISITNDIPRLQHLFDANILSNSGRLLGL